MATTTFTKDVEGYMTDTWAEGVAQRIRDGVPGVSVKVDLQIHNMPPDVDSDPWEEWHVIVTAPTQEALDAAIKIAPRQMW